MVRGESKEVASSQIMEMLVSDIQGDTEKGMWGAFCFIHLKFELADKYSCGPINKVSVRYTNLREQMGLQRYIL